MSTGGGKAGGGKTGVDVKVRDINGKNIQTSTLTVDANGNPVYQAMQASTSEVIADLVAEIQSLRKRLAALESA